MFGTTGHGSCCAIGDFQLNPRIGRISGCRCSSTCPLSFPPRLNVCPRLKASATTQDSVERTTGQNFVAAGFGFMNICMNHVALALRSSTGSSSMYRICLPGVLPVCQLWLPHVPNSTVDLNFAAERHAVAAALCR